ncbi:hypothetical protein PAMC26577_01580 [Caballeronia sordidicola]|uniref:Uncharacterized protein n=1 Tax=Caballeronia sordidicola TaxID=196367 RepID=A0A242N7C6_CABSO|nr:hypothetical protein PAMC26577_01580 [Caballeronia sordidicola]
MRFSLLRFITCDAYDGPHGANVTAGDKNISRPRMSRTNGGARHMSWNALE